MILVLTNVLDPSRGDALVGEAQSNISTTVEKMNRTLVRVSKSHKAINKTLDRVSLAIST